MKKNISDLLKKSPYLYPFLTFILYMIGYTYAVSFYRQFGIEYSQYSDVSDLSGFLLQQAPSLLYGFIILFFGSIFCFIAWRFPSFDEGDLHDERKNIFMALMILITLFFYDFCLF